MLKINQHTSSPVYSEFGQLRSLALINLIGPWSLTKITSHFHITHKALVL